MNSITILPEYHTIFLRKKQALWIKKCAFALPAGQKQAAAAAGTRQKVQNAGEIFLE